VQGSAENQRGCLSTRQQLGKVLAVVRPYRGQLACVFALTLLSTVLGLAYPLLTKFLVDDVLLGRHSRLLLPAAGVLGGIVVLSFGMGALTRYMYSRVSARVLMNLRLQLFGHLQTLSPRFYARTKLGEIIARLSSDVAEIQSVAMDALFNLALSVLTLIGTVAALLYLNWKLTILCGIFVPFSGLALLRFRGRIAGQARTVRERNADLGSVLLESLHGMKWVQTVGAEEIESGKLREKNEQYIRSLLRYQVVSAAAHGVPTAFLSLSTLALLVFGGHAVIAKQMTLGALVAFAAYQTRVLGPLQNMVGLYLSLQRARVSLDRVFELLAVAPEIQELQGACPPARVHGEVEFRNVTFAYEPGTPVLQAVSLRIPAGTRVAIVGPSGAGKSTLLDLLLRFYDPQQGAILLDGHDLRQLPVKSLRSYFGVITCEPFLFHASIRENIAYASPGASEEDVRNAARLADLEAFTDGLPDGLNTIIGERGLRLSAGQRQRIAIARAVLRGARIFVFDEATAALDVLTESRIWDALSRSLAGLTTIIVTHRLSSARGADQIVVLEQGAIVEVGTHDELCRQAGFYNLLQRVGAAGAEVVV
jgi:ATP-binding cassette, subfamily B, bacterial